MDDSTVEVNVKLPPKLVEFIEKKIDEGLFSSVEEFIQHGVRLLAEFYGLSGESVLSKIIQHINITPARKGPSGELSPNEQFLLDAIGKSKFVFEQEIYALILKEAMIRQTKPMSREEFKEALESLIKKGILERVQYGNETIIRKKMEE